jgi:hypothetical protein
MTHPVKTVMKAPLLLLAAIMVAGSAHAQGVTSSLSTISESSIGLSLIGYKYDEPNVMTLKARKVGIDYSGTHAFNPQWPRGEQGWFVRGELQYAVGDADYSSPSSGTLNGTENYYYEIRGQLGRDFQMKGYVLAPYVGLGFRYLFHDLRGTTSTGNSGYRRENDLQTASVGFTHRMQLSGGVRLSTTFEYMHILKGVQVAKLSDVGGGLTDVEMDQNSGHGLRLSSMWRVNQWSFGPTLTYWNIKDSEVASSGGRNWVEPKNKTTELGFKSNFHF